MGAQTATTPRMVPAHAPGLHRHDRRCEAGRRVTAAENARRTAFGPEHLREQEALVLNLMGLVKRVALELREHLPAHVEMDDLVSAGTLGLIDAVRRFQAEKEVKIETYARYRIRGAMLDALRGLDPASVICAEKTSKPSGFSRRWP